MIQRRLAQIDESIARYLSQLDSADRQGEAVPEATITGRTLLEGKPRGGNRSGFELPCAAPIISRHCLAFFSALFPRGARFMRDVYRREFRMRPQRLTSGEL
jgi:hypothetical protein